MATVKQRVHRMNESGSYDVIHYETSSDLVIRPDGTTVESTINSITESSVSISDIGNLWVWGKSNLALEQSNTSNIHTTAYNSASSTTTVYGSIKVENGKIVYSEPYTVNLQQSNVSVLIGYYKRLGDQTAYIIDSVYSSKSTYVEYNVYRIQISNYAGEVIQYLTSLDSTAYPENAQQGNYWYTRLGQIGSMSNGAKIETGSYVGTGTYGQSNPNSVTFDFKPKIIFWFLTSNVTGEYSIDYGSIRNVITPIEFFKTTYTAYKQPYLYYDKASSGYAKISEDGKTISWYHTASASQQNNTSDTKYYYVAIS